MPYYVFKYENTELGRLKELSLLSEFEVFKDASIFAKAQRLLQTEDDHEIIKVMFAENQLTAEENIREKREPRPSGEE